jgi:hypothetical protein
VSDIDPEDESLEDLDDEGPDTEDPDEEDLCEHGIPWDECDTCCDDDLECPHGYSEDEDCPTCDGEEPDDLEDIDSDSDVT